MSTGTIIVISASVAVVGLLTLAFSFYHASRMSTPLVSMALSMGGALALICGIQVAVTAAESGSHTGLHAGYVEEISLNSGGATMKVQDFNWPVACPNSCKEFSLGQIVVIDYRFNNFGSALDYVKVSPTP